jgi:hypothetical protein
MLKDETQKPIIAERSKSKERRLPIVLLLAEQTRVKYSTEMAEEEDESWAEEDDQSLTEYGSTDDEEDDHRMIVMQYSQRLISLMEEDRFEELLAELENANEILGDGNIVLLRQVLFAVCLSDDVPLAVFETVLELYPHAPLYQHPQMENYSPLHMIIDKLGCSISFQGYPDVVRAYSSSAGMCTFD